MVSPNVQNPENAEYPEYPESLENPISQYPQAYFLKILTKPEFPQLPGQYPETFCYIEHCTVLYSAEYQYPSEYKDFFKLGRMITITEYTVVTNNEIEYEMIFRSDKISRIKKVW